jgi:uncharacterized protein (DUF2062 family)
MTSPVTRFAAWTRRTMPTREQLERSRWIPDRVLERELWRFTRRSIPRGVALGLLVGILLPVAQIVFAAILSFSARANVPVASLTTFATNPVTTPAIWALSYYVGSTVLRVDAMVGASPIDRLMSVSDGWMLLHWLTAEGKVLALGLVIVAVMAASAGYLAAALGWRMWIGRKWRNRLAAAQERAAS